MEVRVPKREGRSLGAGRGGLLSVLGENTGRDLRDPGGVQDGQRDAVLVLCLPLNPEAVFCLFVGKGFGLIV